MEVTEKPNRQYNGRQFNLADADDVTPDIEEFNEESVPVQMRTKEEEQMKIKSVELALEFIKLCKYEKIDDIFSCAAMVLKYISARA